MDKESARRTVTQLFELFTREGQRDYIGEQVSQLEHALQCAHFARAAGASRVLVIGALLHDVGHFCPGSAGSDERNGFGVAHHETVGARYLLSCGFSPSITRLVAGHVAAKRYLTHKDPAYLRDLSDASRHTLRIQGGVMSSEEASQFEIEPHFRDMLRLRKWDELGKQVDLEVEDLESYRTWLEESLRRAG